MTKTDKIRTLVWDFNGTLVDDARISVESINIMLKDRGLPGISLVKYRSLFSFPVKDYYEKAGFDFSRESFSSVGREFISIYTLLFPRARIFPEAKRLLQVFNELGIEQFVLSAMEQEMLERSIRDAGLESYFTEVSGIDNIYASSKLKNGKDLFKRRGLEGEKTWIIGDTVHDWQVAEELGCRCLLIGAGHQDISCLRETGCPYILKDHSEIPRRLKF